MNRSIPLIVIAIISVILFVVLMYRTPDSAVLSRDAYLSGLQQSPEAVLIDLRTPEEYASGHLSGAVNIDFYGATFNEQIQALDTAKTYYIYCRSGNRSRQALSVMRTAGITTVYDLQGGVAGNPGLPLIQGAEVGARAAEVEERVDPSDIIPPTSLPVMDADAVLSDTERTGLLYMYEEEKLARDVYTTLGNTWGIRIFANITESEKTHMAAVGRLLERYNIPLPMVGDTVGTFHDTNLQTLYDTLISRGKESQVEALTVGALIEDLDIADLDRYMQETQNTDIKAVYAELQRGSRNHLRAFTRQLNARGASYEPQYISRDTYDAIIESAQEKGKGWW
jgi:rhodanese-related sulfurtransferase